MKRKEALENELKLELPSLSVNEGIARATVAVFCSQLDPTATELADIKCAVSEAVTNCIVHAYRGTHGLIRMNVRLYEGRLIRILIRDDGCGIPDVKQARQPLFTTDAESERSGMGFSIMETFTDRLRVRSNTGRGTSVTMIKRLSPKKGL